MDNFRKAIAGAVLALASTCAWSAPVSGSASCAWVNPTGLLPTIVNSDAGGVASVAWGLGLLGRSSMTCDGLGSDGDAGFSGATGSPFRVADFNYNNRFTLTLFQGADLALTFDFTAPTGVTETITSFFRVQERLLSPDSVTIDFGPAATFTSGGFDYVLSLVGFDALGSKSIALSDGQSASRGLFAQLDAVRAVPEPGTLALLGAMLFAWPLVRRPRF